MSPRRQRFDSARRRCVSWGRLATIETPNISVECRFSNTDRPIRFAAEHLRSTKARDGSTGQNTTQFQDRRLKSRPKLICDAGRSRHRRSSHSAVFRRIVAGTNGRYDRVNFTSRFVSNHRSNSSTFLESPQFRDRVLYFPRAILTAVDSIGFAQQNGQGGIR